MFTSRLTQAEESKGPSVLPRPDLRVLRWFQENERRGRTDYTLDEIGDALQLTDVQVFDRMAELAELGWLDVSGSVVIAMVMGDRETLH